MLAQAWEKLSARGPGWYWIGTHLRNGDMYHACSLARRFIEAQGPTLPIYLVAGLIQQVKVASCFSEYFEEIILGSDMLGMGLDEWSAFFRETGLPAFAPNTPILLHPGFAEMTRGRGLDLLATENDFTWFPLYNRNLRLEANTEPTPHPFRQSAAERARELCESAGITAGRSVLFFPYAQSFGVSAHEHFAFLARQLTEQGFSVFTSVAYHDEQPVDGTQTVFIPFEVLRDVAEYAGWIVAVRSGICDIAASARCRKSFIFRHGKELPSWGVNSMDLCRDAYEIPFHFGLQSPEAFADVVLNNRRTGHRHMARARLSDLLQSQATAPLHSRSFTDFQHAPDGWAELLASDLDKLNAGPAMLRITDVPARDHPRWGYLVDSVVAELVQSPSLDALYVCRDGGRFDFFEEVDREFLTAGHYRAADMFHALVLVSKASLLTILDETQSDYVLPIEVSTAGRAVGVGVQVSDAAFTRYLEARRPFSLFGVQFVEGWEDVEFWGVWSKGRRGALKLAFEETPSGSFGMFLGCRASLSPSFPSTGYSVRVNGRTVDAGLFDLHSNPRVLRVEVPEDVATAGRLFRVEIEVDEVRSPYEQGVIDDDRRLGAALHWVRLDAPGEVFPTIKLAGWFGDAESFEALLQRRRAGASRIRRAQVGVYGLGEGPYLDQTADEGWHFGEPWGRWTSDRSAYLRFRLDADSPVQGLRLRLFAPSHPTLMRFTGQVSLNEGAFVAQLDPDPADPAVEVEISRSYFKVGEVNEIELISDRLVRPIDLDPQNGDTRSLGFAGQSIEFF